MVADAALRLMGREGSRALTHRGVDAEAGLPQGSTSYYCRRRADLVALALQRHAELDRRSLAQLTSLLDSGASATGDLTKQLARHLARWISNQDRVHVVARFELFLISAREPALQEVLAQKRSEFLGMFERLLKRRRVAGPRAVAVALIALIEGLLLERVRAPAQPLRAGELRALLASLLAAG